VELGIEAIAGFYTNFSTCALHGINPRRHLTDVLTKLGTGWPASRLDELLPWNGETTTSSMDRLRRTAAASSTVLGSSYEAARGELVSSSKTSGRPLVNGGDGSRFKQLLFDASDAHVVVDGFLHF